MPKQALSPMPGKRTLPVASRAQNGAVARLVLSHRLHAAARTLRSSPAEQATALRSAVPSECSDAARTRRRPETSGCGHRVSWRAPHLGTEPSPSSAHTLRGSGWRSCTRRFPMDLFLETILPACRRAESRLPGQVRSRTEATLSSAQAPVSRLTPELFHQDWVVYAKPPLRRSR